MPDELEDIIASVKAVLDRECLFFEDVLINCDETLQIIKGMTLDGKQLNPHVLQSLDSDQLVKLFFGLLRVTIRDDMDRVSYLNQLLEHVNPNILETSYVEYDPDVRWDGEDRDYYCVFDKGRSMLRAVVEHLVSCITNPPYAIEDLKLIDSLLLKGAEPKLLSVSTEHLLWLERLGSSEECSKKCPETSPYIVLEEALKKHSADPYLLRVKGMFDYSIDNPEGYVSQLVGDDLFAAAAE
jgi:hypothetical protein